MSKASKISPATFPPTDLYERDYYTWTQEQLAPSANIALRNSIGPTSPRRSRTWASGEKRALRSQLVRLLNYLLKYAYAREVMWANNSRGWELSIRITRSEVGMYLDENPGLRPHVPQIFTSAYRSARLEVMKTLRLPDSAIPEAPPWSLEEITDDAFLPRRDT